MSVISIVEFLTLILLLICYCITRPKDAYLPDFDKTEKQAQDDWVKKMRKEGEKNGRKMSDSSLNAEYLYQKDKNIHLPPPITDTN